MNTNDKYHQILEDAKFDKKLDLISENSDLPEIDNVILEYCDKINRCVTLSVCPNDFSKMPIAGINSDLLAGILNDFFNDCNKSL